MNEIRMLDLGCGNTNPQGAVGVGGAEKLELGSLTPVRDLTTSPTP